MTDRELDELGTSLLALAKQIPRRLPAEPLPPQQPVDEPPADWTAEQMKRLDDVFRG